MLARVAAMLTGALLLGCSIRVVAAEDEKMHTHKALYTSLTKSLPQEKRPQFMELMKKMRLTRQMKKEQKKAAIVQLDAEIHKLLGEDYKRYRTVQNQVQADRQQAKDAATPPPPPALSPPPPPPPPGLQRLKKKLMMKKKMKSAAR